MTERIKAIETHYKGYRFRSRLEARWAVFFDALGIRYEYEKQGFDFGGLAYLPDFWVPEWDSWVEIKGPRLEIPDEGPNYTPLLPDQDTWAKAFCLAGESGKRVYVLCGDCWHDINGVVFDGVSFEHWVPWELMIDFPHKPDFMACPCGRECEAQKMTPPEIVWHILKCDQGTTAITFGYNSPRRFVALARTDQPGKCVLWQSGISFLQSKNDGKIIISTSPVTWPLPSGWDKGVTHQEASSVFSKAFQAARSARFEHGETPR